MNETALFRFGFPSWEEGWNPRALVSGSSAPYLLGLALVMLTTYVWSTSNPSLKKLPYVNPAGFFSDARAKVSLAIQNSILAPSLTCTV